MKSKTKLSHLGRNKEHLFNFVNPPVIHASTALFPNTDKLNRRDMPYPYGLSGTPTTQALEEALADLDGAAGACLQSSGLQAVAHSLLATLSSGDHLLMTDSVYQPTRTFCDNALIRLGIEVTYYDPHLGESIAELFQDNTKVIFTESPGSQTMEMQDIPAIVAAAKSRDIITIIDNTWATPLLFKPLDFGVDISVQAGTKYIVGHSDVMAGVITANEKTFASIKHYQLISGTQLAPDDTYLALRGLRTMGVRLREHEKNTLEVAKWLLAHDKVKYILHPGHESHPDHGIWKRDFKGSSSLFSFVIKSEDVEDSARFLDNLKLFGLGFSWGGFESLAIPFNPTSYRTATSWQEKGQAFRLHIGLEDVEDVIQDLDQALAKVSG